MVADVLQRAGSVAFRCGVTRLADVTGLDHIGMPVFQAVRPWSRALSVHQGKGLTRSMAMVGALMEGVESYHAENFDGERTVASFDELAVGNRAPALSDFALSEIEAPSASFQLAWTPARRLISGTCLMVPFEFVSLDCTNEIDPWIDKSSVGLAAHFERREAILSAIYEVIERDAEWAWRREPIHLRALHRVQANSPPFGWYQALFETIRRSGLRLSLYQIPAIVSLPVFICEIMEPGAGLAARQLVYGSGAHAAPEMALLRSVVEAVQSRVTVIAGVRDDIYYPQREHAPGESIGMALPMPPGTQPRNWDDATMSFRASWDPTPIELASLLEQAGYPDTAIVNLSRENMDAVVVKAVCPGLGSFDRRRRSAGGHK